MKIHLIFRRTTAFTLIELLTVIAIIGILAAILIPVVGAVRNSAKSAKCLSNLRQIGQASLMYANEHNDRLPAREVGGNPGMNHLAEVQLKPYTDGAGGSGPNDRVLETLWRCPSGPEEWMYTYSTNQYYWNLPLNTLPAPSRFVMVRNRGGINNPSDAGGVFTNTLGTPWHGQGYNAVFADGHVDTVSAQELGAGLRSQEPGGAGGYF